MQKALAQLCTSAPRRCCDAASGITPALCQHQERGTARHLTLLWGSQKVTADKQPNGAVCVREAAQGRVSQQIVCSWRHEGPALLHSQQFRCVLHWAQPGHWWNWGTCCGNEKKNARAGSESSTVLRQTLLPLLLLALQHTVLFLQVSDRQSPSDMEIGNNCSTNLKAIVVQPNEQYSKR